MTYCAAMKLDRGIVFASDTRTNAGVDNIAKFRKTYLWRNPGDRVLVLLSAGNLSVSQSVHSILNEALHESATNSESEKETLFTVNSLFRAARLVGATVREVRDVDGPMLENSDTGFYASFIFGGQIGDEPPRLFQIYSEGNFIEATEDTPFLQIGEHKYGKPILDRVADPKMRLGEAAKLLLLSFDSTIRSNLSVGMPLDLLIYERDKLDVNRQMRIEENDPYFNELSENWSEALRNAFSSSRELDI